MVGMVTPIKQIWGLIYSQSTKSFKLLIGMYSSLNILDTNYYSMFNFRRSMNFISIPAEFRNFKISMLR